MVAKEIQVGGIYTARVSGRIGPVQVDRIQHDHLRIGRYGEYFRDATRYHCTNLMTGRCVTFRTAGKFRQPVKLPGSVINPD